MKEHTPKPHRLDGVSCLDCGKLEDDMDTTDPGCLSPTPKPTTAEKAAIAEVIRRATRKTFEQAAEELKPIVDRLRSRPIERDTLLLEDLERLAAKYRALVKAEEQTDE